MFIRSSSRKNDPRSISLATITIVASTLASTSAAISADTVISAPQGTAVTLGEDGTVTVTSTGSITVDPGTVAIDAGFFNSEIVLFGPVSADDSPLIGSVSTSYRVERITTFSMSTKGAIFLRAVVVGSSLTRE